MIQEPILNIKYSQLVQELQNEFMRQGKIQPLKLHNFLLKADDEIQAYKEVYVNYLKTEWQELFPGVSFSEGQFDQILANKLAEKKIEALEKFKASIRKEEIYRVSLYWIFRKWEARFFVSLACSFITIPIFLSLFFAPNDCALMAGGVGVVVNFFLLIIFFFKTITAKEEGDVKKIQD